MFTGVTEYAVYTLDLQGCVATWNAAAERLHGYRAKEILGRHFGCFYPEADRDAGVPEDVLRRALREGRCEASGWSVRKAGNRFMATLIIEALRDSSDKTVGFIMAMGDVTERAKMAHHYNNLVHMVQTGLQVLRRTVPGEHASAGVLDLIEENTRLATNVTRQLFGQQRLADQDTENIDAAFRAFAGLRVVIVEDESLVAMNLEDLLCELGCVIVGIAPSVEKALRIVAGTPMEFAVLDVNLRGELVYPVAEALQARGIPFAFTSGLEEVAEAWRRYPSIQKPFQLEALQQAIEQGRARK